MKWRCVKEEYLVFPEELEEVVVASVLKERGWYPMTEPCEWVTTLDYGGAVLQGSPYETIELDGMKFVCLCRDFDSWIETLRKLKGRDNGVKSYIIHAWLTSFVLLESTRLCLIEEMERRKDAVNEKYDAFSKELER